MSVQTLLADFKRLNKADQVAFKRLINAEQLSHEEVFGGLNGAEFSVHEALEYLGISEATFRRILSSGKLKASSVVGRSHLYLLTDLKVTKQSLKAQTPT